MLPKNKRPIIGIDPDSEKSGVAIYFPDDNKMSLMSLQIMDLMDMLVMMNDTNGILKVYIEASHKNTANWHTSTHDKPSVAAKKGYDVGRCHQVGIILCDFCKKMAVPFEECLPLAKIWSGHDRKCTHDNLLHALSPRSIKLDDHHQKRSNQEERDAALILLGHVRQYSNLPNDK